MVNEVTPFKESLEKSGLLPFKAQGISIFQMNLGMLCNQACKHCHVSAGPNRNELMSDEVVDASLNMLAGSDIPMVDITGGAPEMHPRYREIVKRIRGMGKKVLSRCNLTIGLEPGYEDVFAFFADESLEIVASLPYYREEETDRTRGKGVFEKSIKALKKLNEVGYGAEGSGLVLNLMYNPAGLYFPPPQTSLEVDFKRELGKEGITFNSLFALINMPVGRFAEFLARTGNLGSYMKKLERAYNPRAAECAMCRTTLSVNWEGHMYDCDFNQMLDIRVNHGAPSHISDFNASALESREIMIGQHCYGCTAGSGSSCGGNTA